MYYRGLLANTNRLMSQETYALFKTFKLHDKCPLPMVLDLDSELWERSDSRNKYTVTVFANKVDEVFKVYGNIRVVYENDKEFYYVGKENLTSFLEQYVGEWLDIYIENGNKIDIKKTPREKY